MRQIRANEPKGQRIPALALTAFARAEDRKKALLAGYQAHVAKPVDMAELVIVVAGLVGRN
jgi:CheY-like chemotaxis protein